MPNNHSIAKFKNFSTHIHIGVGCVGLWGALAPTCKFSFSPLEPTHNPTFAPILTKLRLTPQRLHAHS